MAGIDAIKLERFIQKNENIYGSVAFNNKKIKAVLKELDDSYSGKTLNNIFSKLRVQDSNFSRVLPVLESYVSLLKDVRKNYIIQDKLISQYMNKKN
ncbi:MAG: hypothetical protein IKT40_06365 [Bacilli bacterium]|nr:hypothetical protein [Bacilli bacterium]